MLSLFLTAFIFGLIFNAAPGAVMVQTVRESVAGGFRPALAVQLGSLAGDALWALLGLFGVGLLLQLQVLRLPIALAGVVLLLWLAWDAWRAGANIAQLAALGSASKKPLQRGVAISLTNPSNIAFWAAIGSALSAAGVHEPRPIDYLVFFSGFMACSLAWCFFCAATINHLVVKLGPRWAKAIYRSCALALALLAVYSLHGALF